MTIGEKIQILADAAKYDVSCSSSGSNYQRSTTIGTASRCGICHSFTSDGRCISLLKILFSNQCAYDCQYCINRASNDRPRATFSVDELVNLTMEFYRRNYIEGLFLSSAIIGNANHTMELLLQVVEKLRKEQHFGGYIHMKAIPGADPLLIQRAGFLVDRMSVNIELPSARSLQVLAPQKTRDAIVAPMKQLSGSITENALDRKHFRHAPAFVPAGQSTQMIIGASGESDLQILRLSSALYQKLRLKRVYYSAYVPVNPIKGLPQFMHPPLLRENRLYQCDWLMRFYGFDANELLEEDCPNLDLTLDPKMQWALRHLDLFPIEINTANYAALLRVPGLGVVGARKIIRARKFAKLHIEDLAKMGLQLKRARYFITCCGKYFGNTPFQPEAIRSALLPPDIKHQQLTLFPELTQPQIAASLLPAMKETVAGGSDYSHDILI